MFHVQYDFFAFDASSNHASASLTATSRKGGTLLARYLKAQLLVLLCGGLVGPIFLVVYFALGQRA